MKVVYKGDFVFHEPNLDTGVFTPREPTLRVGGIYEVRDVAKTNSNSYYSLVDDGGKVLRGWYDSKFFQELSENRDDKLNNLGI